MPARHRKAGKPAFEPVPPCAATNLRTAATARPVGVAENEISTKRSLICSRRTAILPRRRAEDNTGQDFPSGRTRIVYPKQHRSAMDEFDFIVLVAVRRVAPWRVG